MRINNMKHNYNRHPNQHSQSDPRGLYLMLGIMAVGGFLWYRFQEPVSPFISHSYGVAQVQASESIIESPKTEHEAIVAYIKQVFGDQSDNAFKILECENKGLNPSAINHNRNGSTDHSIFQVNSIHTKRYGSAFKTDWKANIDVAHKIYQASGWSAWACSHKIGIKSFWE